MLVYTKKEKKEKKMSANILEISLGHKLKHKKIEGTQYKAETPKIKINHKSKKTVSGENKKHWPQYLLDNQSKAQQR